MSIVSQKLDPDVPFAEWVVDLSHHEDLKTWLIANLVASGTPPSRWREYFAATCRWYGGLLAQGFERVPFFVVHDLGVLLSEGRRFRFRLLSDESDQAPLQPEARARQVDYQNRVLNRILTIPAFDRCVDALDQKGRPDRIMTWLLERLLEPVSRAPLPVISTSSQLARQLGRTTVIDPDNALLEIETRFEATASWSVLNGGTGLFYELMDIVCHAYENVDVRNLLGPEDVYVIRHFDTLGSRVQRLTARQLSHVEEELGRAPPPPPNWERQVPQVTVDLDDAGYFPQGGLDQLANRGTVENLVRSELVYLDPEQSPDIFTLRFAENELLYYTRDEGQLLRRARTVRLFLELAEVHHILYPGQQVRVASMLQGFINQLVNDLFELFESDAVTVHLSSSGMDSRPVARLWDVRFTDQITRGEVFVHHPDPPPDFTVVPSPLIKPGQLTSVIYIGAQEALSDEIRQRHLRSGMGLFWVTTRLSSDAAQQSNDPQQWAFELDVVAPRTLERLRRLRNALVWRLV